MMLMVAFLDKLKILESGQDNLKFAFIAFIISILGSALGYAIIVFVELKDGSERQQTRFVNAFTGLLGVICNLLGFVAGIVFMALFALGNLG